MTRSRKPTRFEDEVLSHVDAAYNLAHWLIGNEQDAQDVTQEACLRAFRFYEGFNGGSARAWLLTILRNAAYTWLKANRVRQQEDGFDEERHSLARADIAVGPGPSPERSLADAEQARLVEEAIRALPDEFRETLILREMEDLSYREIAEVVDVPIGTVMSRLARGRRLLQTRLAGLLEDPTHEL